MFRSSRVLLSGGRMAVVAAAFILPLSSQGVENYYVASGSSLERVSACGEVLQTIPLGSRLRAAFVAPSGRVWVHKFITTSFVIMDADGKNQRTISANGGAYPTDFAFDATGNGLVLVTGRSNTPLGVQVYDKDGKYQKIHAITAPWPLTMQLDGTGNVWIGHRVGPPTQITKLELATGKTTIYTAPTTTTTLGGNVAVDWPGLGKKGNTWTVGDRSNELLELNPHTSPPVWTVHRPHASAATYGALAVDGNNNLWLSDWSSRQVVHWDIQNKKMLRSWQFTSSPSGFAIDGRGKVLFSGGTQLFRYETTSYTVEQITALQGASQRGPRSTYQVARLRNVLGDADGDGSSNFVEIRAGSSLFDAQSNGRTDLNVKGSQKAGSKIDIEVGGTSVSVIALGTKRLQSPIKIPTWAGLLRLDPTGLVVFLAGQAPWAIRGLPLPSNAVGVKFYMQVVSIHAPGQNEWSNDTCVKIF